MNKKNPNATISNHVRFSKKAQELFLKHQNQITQLQERIASLESQLRQGHGDTWDAAVLSCMKNQNYLPDTGFNDEMVDDDKAEYLNKLFPQITDEQAKELMKPDYSELMKPQSMRKCPICGHIKCLCNVPTI